MKDSVFIAIEGANAQQATIHFKLLKERLVAVGYDVEVFEFPQASEGSSYFIKKMLAGDYGAADKLSPYTATLFYSLDRYEAGRKIKQALGQGKVVLASHYSASSLAEQGSKFTDAVEQRSFFVWEDSLEHQLLDIPRPNACLILTDSQKSKFNDSYNLLAQLFPKDFTLVKTFDGNKQLGLTDVNNRLWQHIKPILPAKPAHPGKSVTVKLADFAGQQKPAVDKLQRQEKQTESATQKLSLAAVLEAQLNGAHVELKTDWQKAGYEYYTPHGLPKKLAEKYDQFMQSLVVYHRAMRGKLKKSGANEQILAGALPLAALFNTKLSLPQSGLQDLASSQNTELQQLVNGKSKAKNGNSGQPEPIDKIIARIASEHLPQALTAQPKLVELVEAHPRNEFKVLVDVLYSHSNLPKLDLESEIELWPYQQKSTALETALANGHKDAARQLRYQFDASCDYRLAQAIISSGLSRDIKLQPATPRYGYDVPKAVDQYGITDEYLECFDKSLELFSSLQAAGRDDLAVYATLAGHRNRCQITFSLLGLKTALSKPMPADLKHLLDEVISQIADHHPIAAASLAQNPAKPVPDKKPSRKSRPRRRGGKPNKS